MKDVFEAIVEHYNGDETLSGLAPLYRGLAKDADDLPHVAMHLIPSKPKVKSGSYDLVEKPLIQFSIWARESAVAAWTRKRTALSFVLRATWITYPR